MWLVMYTCSPMMKVCRRVDEPVLRIMLACQVVAVWLIVGEIRPDVMGDTLLRQSGFTSMDVSGDTVLSRWGLTVSPPRPARM